MDDWVLKQVRHQRNQDEEWLQFSQRRAANIRERRRMFNLNEAFDKLRKKVNYYIIFISKINIVIIKMHKNNSYYSSRNLCCLIKNKLLQRFTRNLINKRIIHSFVGITIN